MGNLEVVRAAELLYALDERDLSPRSSPSSATSGTDIAGMADAGGARRQI